MLLKVYLKESKVHGYGVFAAVDIKEGELIDESVSIIDNCDMHRHKFKGNRIVFSKCSLINSGEPNVRTEHEGRLSRFYALKDIKKDEELFLKYGGYNARKY